ncbi:3-deoxy-D-manno-octulosonic acid transferase [Frigoriglobus tundricola]|uniref:3-deoxy-D-manno-octulosonic acid transferase n=1 Tax=Frigoriglobus tundricola TaxID=2774151 RepID=A0A6M5YSM2_9BACT|nr:3-deoxy-D-manno-octulosonic acid transferase [Frigoriglobus tundricola]QJW96406.1 alpha-3-deoxy-D-manno-octulosonic-acid transferase [Frigoriglobus tundricola]
MLLDLVYLLVLLLLSPWLVWRALTTGRYRRGLGEKFFGPARAGAPCHQPVVWFHAVSVGEVNLLGTLVPVFQTRHPDWRIVVSATTDTGLAEARKKFPGHDVIAWPLDFSWAVSRAFDVVKPALVVLTESELWPNFLAAARGRNVPVVVVNARMSPRSFRRLARIAGVARRFLFRHVTRFAVQEEEYADRFRQLGIPAERIITTGSIKYDGAASRDEQKTQALGATIGLGEPTPPTPLPEGKGEEEPTPNPSLKGGEPDLRNSYASGRSEEAPHAFPPLPSGRGAGGVGRCVLLAGSTHAPEESIVLDIYARLRVRFPHLRLILVPRHPDRFEEVSRLVEASGLPFARRSRIATPLSEMPAVVVLDTVGELGAAWGLADVGFTGGSLDGVRGGQSMIEPAGYGVPCVFGPHVWNFKDAARRLVEVGGAFVVKDAAELERELARLVADPDLRARTGTAARELVRRQQGATRRTLDVLDAVISSPALTRAVRTG